MKKITVYTAGSFDMLHVGHTNILKKAKKLGDCLIVGVSSDALIRKYKHLSPIISYKDRASVVKDLKYVNEVIKQDRFFDVEQLRPYRIDIIVLGNDWENKSFPELENCLKTLNIKMIYLPYTKRLSSSSIKEKIIRMAIPIIRSQSKRSK